MEARNVIIVSTRTQMTKTVLTTAENLGDLKADLDEAGIDYSGMVFQEGLTKAEYTDDAAILPKDVMFRGHTTNELVFRLTTPDKKVSSGSISRSELYSKIKEYGLQDVCIKETGSPFISSSNEELEAIITDYEKSHHYAEGMQGDLAPQDNTRKVLVDLIEVLYDNDSIDDSDYNHLHSTLTNSEAAKNEKVGSYNKGEINEMFN